MSRFPDELRGRRALFVGPDPRVAAGLAWPTPGLELAAPGHDLDFHGQGAPDLLLVHCRPDMDVTAALRACAGFCPCVALLDGEEDDFESDLLGRGADECVALAELEIPGRLWRAVRNALSRFRKGREDGRNFSQAMLDAIPVPVFFKDLAGNYLIGNTAFRSFARSTETTLSGQDAGAVFGSRFPRKTLRDVIHDEECLLASRRSGSVVRELKLLEPSGEESTVLLYKNLLLGGGGHDGFVGAVVDLTDVKRTEAALVEVEHKLNTILNSLNELVVYHDNQMRILWVNKAVCDFFGKKRLQLLGKHCHKLWFDRDSPCDDCPFVSARKGGSRVLSFAPSVAGDRLFNFYCAAINDKTGALNGGIEVALEVTEQKHAELEARVNQRKLLQADKLASLGRMVAEVAHEINNAAGLVTMNAPMLRDCWRHVMPVLEAYFRDNGDFSLGGIAYSEIKDDIPKICDDMRDGALKIKRIVGTLKAFSRNGSDELNDVVNLNDVAQSALSLAINTINKSTDNFRLELRRNLPLLRANAQQLEQVLVNLLLNACQALPSRERGLTLLTEWDEAACEVLATVRDEGVGIPEDILPRVFDAFFTTKGDSGGTGLGLSISYDIIQKHHGQIDIKSTPGKGTAVELRLKPQKTP